MNAELLYTSAPQGLKQGSRGFCTVLSTQGMPINLASKLESLSGYRHVYPSGTPEDSLNPVAYSHWKFSVGGRSVSLLSRVAAYGLDYSQRTNKIAHHVVLDDPLPTCGPAALLLAPGFMRDHWDGQCQTITAPLIPAIEANPSRCQKWESLTGDAGWGGQIAETWLERKSKPTFIIFSIDQSGMLLGLLAESISLLPPNKRWQATFGTYITTLPPDLDCRVRCVVAGSEEARMASARGVVIDLSKPNSLGSLPASNSVRAAREGVLIGSETKEAYHAKQTYDPDTLLADESKPTTVSDNKYVKCELDLELNTNLTDRLPPKIEPLSNRLPTTPPASPHRVRIRDTSGQRKVLVIAAITICLLIVGIGSTVMIMAPNQMAKLVPESLPETQSEPQTTDSLTNQELESVATGAQLGSQSGSGNGPQETGEGTAPADGERPKDNATNTKKISGTANSATNEATLRKTDYDASDFEIKMGGFLLPNDKAPDSPIPLKAGIPESTLTATLNLEKLRKRLGESSDEYLSLETRLKTSNAVRWTWEQIDGDNLSTLDASSSRSDGQSLSTTLSVDQNFKPGTRIRVTASVKIESNKNEDLDIKGSEESIADYVTITAKAADFLKDRRECHIDLEKPEHILNENYGVNKTLNPYEIKLELTEGTSSGIKPKIRNLLDNTKSSTQASENTEKILQRLESIMDKRNVVDKHRDSIESFLKSRLKDFNTNIRRKTNPNQNTLPTSIMTDLIRLCEANLDVNPKFGIGWRTSALEARIRGILENKVVWDTIEKKLEDPRKPNNLTPEEIEFGSFKKYWKEPSIEGETPEAVFQKLVQACNEYEMETKKFGQEMSEPITLGSLNCFGLETKTPVGADNLPTKQKDRQRINLWAKLKISTSDKDKSQTNSAVQSKKANSKPVPSIQSPPEPPK